MSWLLIYSLTPRPLRGTKNESFTFPDRKAGSSQNGPSQWTPADGPKRGHSLSFSNLSSCQAPHQFPRPPPRSLGQRNVNKKRFQERDNRHASTAGRSCRRSIPGSFPQLSSIPPFASPLPSLGLTDNDRHQLLAGKGSQQTIQMRTAGRTSS